MATTQKGIYYPDDYTAVADVPEDMKKQAESVDTALDTKVDKEEGKGLSTYNFGPVAKTRLDALWREKPITDTDIARLKATLPTTMGTGENITLSKTAELEFIQPPLPRGNSEQVQYSGKNKLEPYELTQQTINGVTFTPVYENGLLQYINVNGTATENASYYIRPTSHRQTFSAGTYILNGCPTNDTIIQLFGSANTLSSNFYDTGSGATFTLNSESNVWINLQVFSGKTANNLKVYPMIRPSSVTDGTYEPYVGGTASPNPSYPQTITNVTGDVEVKIQNKNLALNDDPENPDANYKSSGGGTTIVQYSSTEEGYYTANHRRRSFGMLKAGTYTVSVTAKARSGTSAFTILTLIKGYSDNIISKSSLSSNYTRFSYTFTISENKEFAVVFYDTLYWKDIQLEEFSTASTYTLHKEQTYTFPLGTQRMFAGDYLADDGIHHVRKQIVLDGSEDENYAIELKTGYSIPKITIDDMAKVNNGIGLSSHFTRYSSHNAVIGAISFGWINKVVYMYMPDTITSVADFKAWLSTHNVTLEYPLAEEEITPYTTEQQQAYDEIKQALSYEKQTNISGSSDESNPLFSVEAYQSTKLVLQEISNAVVALGGV